MESILQDLHEDDHFAIILFDHMITTWKDSLTKATKEIVAEAVAYANKINDRGGKQKQTQVVCKMSYLLPKWRTWKLNVLLIVLLATNINGAVLRGVEMLQEDRRDHKLPERSSDMIILLTDGMPNYGEHADCGHCDLLCALLDTLWLILFIPGI